MLILVSKWHKCGLIPFFSFGFSGSLMNVYFILAFLCWNNFFGYSFHHACDNKMVIIVLVSLLFRCVIVAVFFPSVFLSFLLSHGFGFIFYCRGTRICFCSSKAVWSFWIRSKRYLKDICKQCNDVNLPCFLWPIVSFSKLLYNTVVWS